MTGVVLAVSRSASHYFSKDAEQNIHLLAGLGVEGDAHSGVTVKHRSRVAKDPTQPNLRQVHLLHVEMIDELQAAGFAVVPGTIGENITTKGLDLLALPRGSLLKIGESAVLEVTGLRNPCVQLDDFQRGLTAALIECDSLGHVVRKAGIMSIVRESGTVRSGDTIVVVLPHQPHQRLEPV